MQGQEAIKGKEKQWAQMISRCWVDEGYKERLLKDPRAVLKESGIGVPENIKINILETKEDEITLTLPPRPAAEVSIEELSGRLAAWALT